MAQLFGLIGGRLGHSFSPQIHRLIMEKTGIDGTYELFETQEAQLKSLIETLKSAKAAGVNITIPYKTGLMKYLDQIAPEARKIGAINTIDFKEGILTGYNTDYHGFGAALNKNGIETPGKSAYILGTGGASKAVVQYLADHSAKEIVLVSRDPKKENNAFPVISYEALEKVRYGDILINSTPVGMSPNIGISPVNKRMMSKFESAVDLIYNPEKTLFLQDADALGKKAVNGLYMLVAQAVAAQVIWQGKDIGVDTTDEVYETLKSILYSGGTQK